MASALEHYVNTVRTTSSSGNWKLFATKTNLKKNETKEIDSSAILLLFFLVCNFID